MSDARTSQITDEQREVVIVRFLMDFEQAAFRKVRSGWTGDDEGFTADQIAEFTKTYGEWASALEAALEN